MTQSYTPGMCTTQNYSVTIASNHSQLVLANKRLKLTAMNVEMSAPVLNLGPNTYLSTPLYFVCTGGGDKPGSDRATGNGTGGAGSGSPTPTSTVTAGIGSGGGSSGSGGSGDTTPPPQPTTITAGNQGQIISPYSYIHPPTYLHGDHLGSVSVVTDHYGNPAGTQEFDPWG